MGKAPSIPALRVERETGFGPATLSLGKRSSRSATRRKKPQPPEVPVLRRLGLPHLAYRAAASIPKFGATLGAAGEHLLGGHPGAGFLTAREVAKVLRVSTATVYSLCDRGELEHQRVSNAIRIQESALARYLDAAAASSAGPGADDERAG